MDHSSLTVDGVATEVIRYYSGGGLLDGFQIGPYVQGNGTKQLPPTPTIKTTDMIAYGGFMEVALATGDLTQDFRLHGGEVAGNSPITYNTFVGEWLPTYASTNLNIGVPIPTGNLYYSLSPELMTQYDHLNTGLRSYAIFGSSTQDLRLGPLLQIRVWPNDKVFSSIQDGVIKTLLSSSFMIFTAHVDRDVLSGRNYEWASVGLASNLTSNIGVSTSFGVGDLEATGNRGKQYKAGLTVKF